MPHDFYVSANLTLPKNKKNIDDEISYSNFGMGIHTSIGKEWATPEWMGYAKGAEMGLSLFLYISRTKDKPPVSSSINNYFMGLAFTFSRLAW